MNINCNFFNELLNNERLLSGSYLLRHINNDNFIFNDYKKKYNIHFSQLHMLQNKNYIF